MKGRIAVLGHLDDGREAAALIVDGRLENLLIDPPDGPAPRPGAIFRARADRPLKGQNGMLLNLPDGQSGFLRQARGIGAGQSLLVQISTWGEEGKAAPVSPKLLFKGRWSILTPGAPGRNIARSIRDEALRDALAEIAAVSMEGAAEDLGLILRSASAGADADEIAAEIAELRRLAETLLKDTEGPPELLLQAPSAHEAAWRDWSDPSPEEVFRGDNALAEHGVAEMIDALRRTRVPLAGGAYMHVEPTRALVAVDVNTGSDFSPAAGLKANLAALRELPRQLRLRGLGGQVVIDLAPLAKKDRRQAEQALARALRRDGTDTAIVGWTPLGHLELQRKRERLPLAALLPG